MLDDSLNRNSRASRLRAESPSDVCHDRKLPAGIEPDKGDGGRGATPPAFIGRDGAERPTRETPARSGKSVKLASRNMPEFSTPALPRRLWGLGGVGRQGLTAWSIAEQAQWVAGDWVRINWGVVSLAFHAPSQRYPATWSAVFGPLFRWEHVGSWVALGANEFA